VSNSKFTPQYCCAKTWIPTSTRDKVCSGEQQVTLPGGEAFEGRDAVWYLQCLRPSRCNLPVVNRCISNPVFNSWLFLWAQSCGFSLESHEGWDPASGVWMATTNLYSRLADSGDGGLRYCLADVMDRIPLSLLTARDAAGRFHINKMYFPVFKSPGSAGGIGHWFYVGVKPNKRRMEMGDSSKGKRSVEVALIAKLWDDICTLALGFNQNAQSWPVDEVSVGQQEGSWECCFFALNGIACSCADQQAQLSPAQVEKMKLLLAQDFVQGGIRGDRPSSGSPPPLSPPALSVSSVNISRHTPTLEPAPPAPLQSASSAPALTQPGTSPTSGAQQLWKASRRQWDSVGVRLRSFNAVKWGKRPKRVSA
jgi:hypothetical protein